MIDRRAQFYRHENSNIHRGAHELAARATDAYEKARETARRFINAPDVDEILFVRGTTEGINLVAKSCRRRRRACRRAAFDIDRFEGLSAHRAS